MSDHGDDVCVLLPDHLPEGAEGGRRRALRPDVRPRGAEAVDVVGVDVLVLLLAGALAPQSHPRVIV